MSIKTTKTSQRLAIGLFILASLYSFFLFINQWPFQPIRLWSAAEHYYFAQQVASGGVLYRDFAYNKTPLTIYIGSIFFLINKHQLIPSVVQIRFLFWLLIAASGWPIYILGKEILRKEFFSWIGIFIFLSFPFMFHHIAGEPDWHVLMTTLGLFSFAFAIKKNWMISGVFAALAFFSWQPGGAFLISVITAQLYRNRPQSWRNIGMVLAGFLIVTLLFIVYFVARGNLQDFIKFVFMSTQNNIKTDFFNGMHLIPKYIRLCYAPYKYIIATSLLGLFVHGVRFLTLRHAKSLTSADSLLVSITALTILYSFIDFQHCDDFLVFLPWISLYSVYLIDRFFLWKFKTISKVMGLLLLVVVVYPLATSIPNPLRNWDLLTHKPLTAALDQQQSQFKQKLRALGLKPSDDVVCIETALPCLLLNKTNYHNKYVYMLHDYYIDFIKDHEPETEDIFFDTINSRKAAYVFTWNTIWHKRGQKIWGQRLKRLLEKKYDFHEYGRLWIYVRKNEER